MDLDLVRREFSELLLPTVIDLADGKDEDLRQFTKDISTDLVLAITTEKSVLEHELTQQLQLVAYLHDVRATKRNLRALARILQVAVIVGTAFLRGL